MYRDLDWLFVLIRDDCAYQGVVPVYMAGDPELARYKAIAKEDRLPSPPDKADGTS